MVIILFSLKNISSKRKKWLKVEECDAKNQRFIASIFHDRLFGHEWLNKVVCLIGAAVYFNKVVEAEPTWIALGYVAIYGVRWQTGSFDRTE